MAPQTIDLLFTIAASLSLLVLFITAALVLPWTEEELDEVESALRHISGRRSSAIVVGKSSPAKLPGALLSRARGTGVERL
ncbi:MAG: hypothetical protein VXW32_16130 [Myxococcota bacterium]|jgi:hypothetical protein|nr:hypothetical protein [Myxococcota bacterium]